MENSYANGFAIRSSTHLFFSNEKKFCRTADGKYVTTKRLSQMAETMPTAAIDTELPVPTVAVGTKLHVPIACLLAWPERAVCQQWKMAVGILCVSCSGQHIGCNWLLKKRIFLYLVEKKLAVWKARSHGNFRNTMFKVGQKLTRQE
jgi:hypothetical protein